MQHLKCGVSCDTFKISYYTNICRIFNYQVYIYLYIIIVDLDFIDLTGNENKLKEKIEEICENKIKLHLGRDQDSSRPWLMSCNAKFQKTENKIDVTGTIQERLPNTQLPGMNYFIDWKIKKQYVYSWNAMLLLAFR